METNYVTLESLKPKHNNTKFHDADINDGINVYQVQPFENYAIIMCVGIMETIHDILIKEFEVQGKYKCHMVSKIYDDDFLKTTSALGRFPILNLMICNKKSENYAPIAYISYNFN